MTPRITRQTKILIRNKPKEVTNWNTSKFAVLTDPVPTVNYYRRIETRVKRFKYVFI